MQPCCQHHNIKYNKPKWNESCNEGDEEGQREKHQEGAEEGGHVDEGVDRTGLKLRMKKAIWSNLGMIFLISRFRTNMLPLITNFLHQTNKNFPNKMTKSTATAATPAMAKATTPDTTKKTSKNKKS